MPKLQEYCGKSFSIDPEKADPFKWHFYNAVFFVITVVSTIGTYTRVSLYALCPAIFSRL